MGAFISWCCGSECRDGGWRWICKGCGAWKQKQKGEK
jgi:hypothetical protein